MVMIEAFLDTSVLIAKILRLSAEADALFNDSNIVRYTNEYAIKEVYRVLKARNLLEQDIAYDIEFIRETCIVLPNPTKNQMRKYKIRDHSDRPFVCSAAQHDLVLYIDDEKTYQDAKKYVKVKRINKD